MHTGLTEMACSVAWHFDGQRRVCSRSSYQFILTDIYVSSASSNFLQSPVLPSVTALVDPLSPLYIEYSSEQSEQPSSSCYRTSLAESTILRKSVLQTLVFSTMMAGRLPPAKADRQCVSSCQ